MRKISLLLAGFALVIVSSAQLQRLAVLPSALKIGQGSASYIPSLCIDFFRDAPSAATPGKYSHYSSHSGVIPESLKGTEFNAKSFSKVSGADANKLSSSNLSEALLMSTENDLNAVSRQKSSFLNERITFYKNNGPFNSAKLEQLQNEIWAFDILEQLGYINRTLSSRNAYEAGLNRFASDFLPSGVMPIPDDVLSVGDLFTEFKLAGKSKKPLLIFKSQQSTNYIVYDKIGAPFYKGPSSDNIGQLLASRTNTDDIVEVITSGFESDLREKSFLINLKRKIRFNHGKDIVLTNFKEGFTWRPTKYRITKDFNQANVLQTTVGNQVAYKTSVELSSDNVYLENIKTTIEGLSNKRNALVRFFDNVMSRVRATTDAITLGKVSRAVRKQTMEALQMTNDDFLDVIISSEGGAKEVVRIRKGRIEIIEQYAKN